MQIKYSSTLKVSKQKLVTSLKECLSILYRSLKVLVQVPRMYEVCGLGGSMAKRSGIQLPSLTRILYHPLHGVSQIYRTLTAHVGIPHNKIVPNDS